MAGRPYVLEETTWSEVRVTGYRVAILPWGAMEAHNLHLPFGTDNLQARAVAVEAARIAWEQDLQTIVLPTIPIGVNAQNRGLPLTLNLYPSTQKAILQDILERLEDSGIDRLVIINGHGGNDFKSIIRELEPKSSVFMSTINWWTVISPDAYFDEPGDHAGEMETSVVQFLYPELVLPLEKAGPGREHPSKLTALRERWAWAPREWRKISNDTGVGDPRAATPEKGEAFFQDACQKIASYLVELADADLGGLYEHS